MSAIGFSLIYGTTGLVNFAQSELIVFGALAAFFFNSILGLNLIIAGLLALVFGGLGSAALDLGLWRPLRKRGTGLTAMMIISIGLALFLRFLFLFLFGERSRPYEQYAVQTEALFSAGPIDVLPKELLIIVVCTSMLVGTAIALPRHEARQGDAGRGRQQRPRRLHRHRCRSGHHVGVVRRGWPRHRRRSVLRAEQPDQLVDGTAVAAPRLRRRDARRARHGLRRDGRQPRDRHLHVHARRWSSLRS